MTIRERENKTLNFEKVDRGSVEETFYPWTLTTQRYKREGIPAEIIDGTSDITNDLESRDIGQYEKYFPVEWGKSIMEYETYLGFDPVRRVSFILPFRRFDEKVIEANEKYVIRTDIFGRQMIKKAGSELELVHKNTISSFDEWKALKEHAEKEIERYFTDEAIDNAYAHLKEGHDRGDYSIRMHIEGFFWVPRELLGDEEYLCAFYDDPEMLHDISEYILKIYETKLMRAIRLIEPDVVYLMEDLSGKTGPMISGAFFDEFIGAYYKRLIPKLKEAGVKNVIVDTDGDFNKIIPNFIASGVDGFLPMDVNAGMDIVKVRKQFPNLKFIGGYNKLMIEKGKEAIDAEFERILPVVRGGGYIVGNDHQVPPSAPLELYKYYIQKLKEVMKQSGMDL